MHAHHTTQMQAIVQQIYHKSTQQRFALEEKHFT
jgi:hypothetical protein